MVSVIEKFHFTCLSDKTFHDTLTIDAIEIYENHGQKQH